MKQLKCRSCGGPIKINEEDEKKYVTCEYCGAQYELETDLNEQIYKDVKNVIKARINISKKIVKGVFIFILVTTVISMIGTFFISKDFYNKSSYLTEDKAKIKQKEKEEEIKKFNRDFEFYGGTQSKYMTEELLDDVSTNNRKNNRKITIKYKDIKTETTEEMIIIKHSLTNDDYEIIIDYDQDGYINKITIEKVEYENKEEY